MHQRMRGWKHLAAEASEWHDTRSPACLMMPDKAEYSQDGSTYVHIHARHEAC